MTWITFFAVWTVLLVLFVWGNKRWQDRMARMDADMEQAMQQHRQQQHAKHGRKYG
jgi:hypothetical protein